MAGSFFLDENLLFGVLLVIDVACMFYMPCNGARAQSLAKSMSQRFQELASAAYAPNGDEHVYKALHLPRHGDCGTDACWEQASLAEDVTERQDNPACRRMLETGYWGPYLPAGSTAGQIGMGPLLSGHD